MLNREQWDEAYATGEFQNHWGIPYPSPELVSFIASHHFPTSTVAVDIGCGAGQESIFLAQQGFSVTGVDLSSEALKIASERSKQAGVQVRWHNGNVLELPLEDQSVDLVNDRGCFHIIPNENRAQYANEMARILKPGGRIFLRGCRDQNNPTFAAITQEVVDQYFGSQFTHGPILPILLVNKRSENDLPANLVVLTRRG